MDESKRPRSRPSGRRAPPEPVFEVKPKADLPSKEGAGGEATPAEVGTALQELAKAFQANAEAMRDMHGVHADLSETLKRADRSEMVLQSTGALNETFRNLTSVQRELLNEVEDKRRGTGRLVPLMLLGLLIVVLGGIYLVIEVMDRQQGSARQTATAPRGGAEDERPLVVFQEGYRKAKEEARGETERLERALAEAEGRARASDQALEKAQRDLVELQRRHAAAQGEVETLGQRVLDLRHATQESELKSRRIAVLESEMDMAEERAERLAHEIQELRRQNSYFRMRIAESEIGLPVEPEAMPAPVPSSDRDPEAGEGATPGAAVSATGSGEGHPSAVPPRPLAGAAPEGAEAGGSEATPPATALDGRPASPVDRNPAFVARAKHAVNVLLGAAPLTHGGVWRMDAIDGVAEDRLAGIRLNEYGAQGNMLSSIHAADLRIHVDRRRGLVTFVVRGGTRQVIGEAPKPLDAAGVSFVVASGPALAGAWAQSGLRMVEVR